MRSVTQAQCKDRTVRGVEGYTEDSAFEERKTSGWAKRRAKGSSKKREQLVQNSGGLREHRGLSILSLPCCLCLELLGEDKASVCFAGRAELGCTKQFELHPVLSRNCWRFLRKGVESDSCLRKIFQLTK